MKQNSELGLLLSENHRLKELIRREQIWVSFVIISFLKGIQHLNEIIFDFSFLVFIYCFKIFVSLYLQKQA